MASAGFLCGFRGRIVRGFLDLLMIFEYFLARFLLNSRRKHLNMMIRYYSKVLHLAVFDIFLHVLCCSLMNKPLNDRQKILTASTSSSNLFMDLPLFLFW